MSEPYANDEKLFLIPTRTKYKLPKTMSYPIGAESVSLALADVPQRDQAGDGEAVDHHVHAVERPSTEGSNQR